MAWTATNIGVGFNSPLGANAPNQSMEYPDSSGNSYEESVLAYIDNLALAIAKEDNITTSQGIARRAPELFGLWNNMKQGTSGVDYAAADVFVDDELAFGLRRRGVTPVIVLSPNPGTAQRLYDASRAYQGALTPGSGTYSGKRMLTPSQLETDFGSGFLDDWDPSDGDRNWAQRVIDGDYDDWLDDFANAIDDFATLNSYGGETLSVSVHNDKGYDVVDDTDDDYAGDYNNVIVRLAYEMNGGLSHSVHVLTSDANFGRARDEFVVAWAYISHRVRDIASNAFFLYNLIYQSTKTPASESTEPRDHSGVRNLGSGGNYKSALWNNALREGYVQFLGTDLYDGKGEGIRFSNAESDAGENDGGVLIYGSRWYDHYEAIWQYYGDQHIPMIVGEFGVNMSCDNNNRTTADERKFNCSSGETDESWNEECRGHYLKDSADTIYDVRKNGGSGAARFRALKGMLYFNIDLPQEGDPAQDNIWALLAEHVVGGGSWVPLDGAVEVEPRPTLADAKAGNWKNSNSGTSDASSNFAFKKFAGWWDHSDYESMFRGHGASVFEEMSD